MRIVHWYPNFLSGGGIANPVLCLANAQAKLGAKTFIITDAPMGSPLYANMEANLSGVELIKWKPSWIINRKGFLLRGISRETRRSFSSIKPDIVNIHAEFNPDNFWVPSIFKCPIVVTPHGALSPIVLHKGNRVAKQIYILIAQKWIYRKAIFQALTPAESNYIRRVLLKTEVFCIPQGPGFQIEQFLKNRGHLPPRKNMRIRFIFLGRLDIFQKGLDILLEAYARASGRMENQETILTFVGPDWRNGRLELERQAESLGLMAHIHFAGSKSGDDLVKMLGNSDIYIQLSRYEGLPSSVTEALLFGKPAILSQAVGTVSFPQIASLPHVLVVPLSVKEAANAIEFSVNHLGELKKSAKQHLSDLHQFFSWDRIAMLHLERYRTLTASKQSLSCL
jgi:glycosyltransferase involved in cell wall biosynthesis